MHFPKFALLLNKFREPVGASSYGSHTVYSCFSLVHLFSVKSGIAVIKQKGGITDIAEMFNAIKLSVHLFRLIAGHMPKPVKLRDVLQYILSSGESEVKVDVC